MKKEKKIMEMKMKMTQNKKKDLKMLEKGHHIIPYGQERRNKSILG